MLTVVQHQQGGLPRKGVRDRVERRRADLVGDPETVGDVPGEQGRVGQRRQLHQMDPTGKASAHA